MLLPLITTIYSKERVYQQQLDSNDGVVVLQVLSQEGVGGIWSVRDWPVLLFRRGKIDDEAGPMTGMGEGFSLAAAATLLQTYQKLAERMVEVRRK